jgi:hypothetical protein
MRLERREWIWISYGPRDPGRAWHAAALDNWGLGVLRARWRCCYECVLNPKNQANQMAEYDRQDAQRTLADLKKICPEPVTKDGYDWFEVLPHPGPPITKHKRIKIMPAKDIFEQLALKRIDAEIMKGRK